ncbi:MAG: hypothetical protein QOE28_433 [Solirubrobacteraceae bacterium]|nr:hypothetical protein [Solirubrobacteraceae bacterium]
MDPDDLMGGPAVEAAVAALAERNRHHLEQMTAEERADAMSHWRDLAMTVLAAARSATGDGSGDGGRGRATIVLEDAGGDEVTVHATFWPEVQDLGGGEVAATPAQAAALELLSQLAPDDEEDEPPLA